MSNYRDKTRRMWKKQGKVAKKCFSEQQFRGIKSAQYRQSKTFLSYFLPDFQMLGTQERKRDFLANMQTNTPEDQEVIYFKSLHTATIKTYFKYFRLLLIPPCVTNFFLSQNIFTIQKVCRRKNWNTLIGLNLWQRIYSSHVFIILEKITNQIQNKFSNT